MIVMIHSQGYRMSDEPKRLQYFLGQVSSLRNTDPDVTITIVDESEQELGQFQGHKIILAVWSDFMRNLFQYEGHQSVYNLKLPTDQPEVLGGILNWMYHQQLEVSEETLTAWIKTADFLLIQPLVDDLNKCLLEKLSPQSCLHLRKASVDQNNWIMKETIEHYMVKNYSDVVASQAYKGLTMDESHKVLSSMTEYLHQFLRSRKNLKNYSFITTVWDFAVCHGQKDLIELSIKSFVRVRHTMEFNHLPINRNRSEQAFPLLSG